MTFVFNQIHMNWKRLEGPELEGPIKRSSLNLTVPIKRCGSLDGSLRWFVRELEGPEHFEKKCQNVAGAPEPAAGAAAASVAASAACIYYGVLGGRFAPP